MSKYTTGEMAKACGITVRAVQYYDSRNILVPSELSEGGRRLYSEEDLKRLKIICFLRDAGISIDSIKQLFSEEHPEKVISLLLEEQSRILNAEIGERREQLKTIEYLTSELRGIDNFTVESIGDIARIMENRKKLRVIRLNMLIAGIIMDAVEVVTLYFWIAKGWWLPFVIGLIPIVALGVAVSAYYFKETAYICPECHTVFKAGFKESFWAPHTPRARKLTCRNCGHRGFCIETYGGDKNA